jgi:hypothetical protein
MKSHGKINMPLNNIDAAVFDGVVVGVGVDVVVGVVVTEGAVVVVGAVAVVGAVVVMVAVEIVVAGLAVYPVPFIYYALPGREDIVPVSGKYSRPVRLFSR